MRKYKLAVCTTHPIQYQAPVWRHLSTQPDIELKVFFASDFSVKGYKDRQFGVSFKWDQPLTEGYDHIFLGSDLKGGFFSMDGKRLRLPLKEFQPDVGLVCGYFPKYFLDAVMQLKRIKAKVMMRAELTDVDHSRSRIKASIRDLAVRSLYGQIDHFISIGEHCRQHLVRMGIADSQISFGGYNVDDALFGRHVKTFGSQRGDLRKKMGIEEDTFVFLTCGKLIPKKNPLLLARAYRTLQKIQPKLRTKLIFLGDGELKEQTLAAAGEEAGKTVEVTGFVNQEEIGKYYAVADCAVLPSAFGETWGLVVNEAQIFGLPVIVSDRVGSFPDLVTPETGRVFPSGDELALVDTLKSVIPWVRSNSESIAFAARAKVANYTSEKAAAAIANAAKKIVI